MTASTAPAPRGGYAREQLERALLAPIRAFRWTYLPLLMVYFAYGALGIVAIAQSFWVKTALTMTPAELAGLSVWLTLPWAVKMVFGELVDAVPILDRSGASTFSSAQRWSPPACCCWPDRERRRHVYQRRHGFHCSIAAVRHRRGAAGRRSRCHEHRSGAAHACRR
ncbi:MAG: folate/biopterin family MFS transporter [Sphingomonadales bacterium]|nr:folate/biopterin family MFS transporter [Sphingomonadales bacterium]